MKMPDFSQKEWKQVDDYQYVKRISDNVYEIFDQIFYGEYDAIFFEKIDVTQYSNEQINEYVESYYNSLEEVKTEYGNPFWKQVIAEIIAECSEHIYCSKSFANN